MTNIIFTAKMESRKSYNYAESHEGQSAQNNEETLLQLKPFDVENERHC